MGTGQCLRWRPVARSRVGVLSSLLAVTLGLAACQQPPSGGLASTEAPVRSTLGPKWLVWPDDDGCADTPRTIILQPGTTIDRYGDNKGRFFAEPGTPFPARSLPYDESGTRYTVYVVRQPLAVEACRIRPWFDQAGGGTQFKSAAPAVSLLTDGIIAPR